MPEFRKFLTLNDSLLMQVKDYEDGVLFTTVRISCYRDDKFIGEAFTDLPLEKENIDPKEVIWRDAGRDCGYFLTVAAFTIYLFLSYIRMYSKAKTSFARDKHFSVIREDIRRIPVAQAGSAPTDELELDKYERDIDSSVEHAMWSFEMGIYDNASMCANLLREHEEGRKSAILETAKRMLDIDVPIETIIKYTEISQGDMEALMSEIIHREVPVSIIT